jgi:hypothetical protein
MIRIVSLNFHSGSCTNAYLLKSIALKKIYRASQPEVSRYTLDDSSGYACGGQSVLIYLLPLTPTGVAVVAIAANYLWPILNTPRYTVTLLMTYNRPFSCSIYIAKLLRLLIQ